MSLEYIIDSLNQLILQAPLLPIQDPPHIKQKDVNMKIIGLILLVIGTQAHADIANLNQNLTVNCKGSQGFLHLEKTASGLSYQIASPAHSIEGSVPANLDDGKVFVSDFANTVTPYSLKATWLDVGFQKGHYVWQEETEACQPTRALVPCQPYTVPAHFERSWTDFVSVDLDITDPKDVKFIQVDLDPGPAIQTLGDDTHCEVQGL
jgi:hypothetical protein